MSVSVQAFDWDCISYWIHDLEIPGAAKLKLFFFLSDKHDIDSHVSMDECYQNEMLRLLDVDISRKIKCIGFL